MVDNGQIGNGDLEASRIPVSAWFQPGEDSAPLIRLALELLRPHLTLIWLDIRQGHDAWPQQLKKRRAAERAARRRAIWSLEREPIHSCRVVSEHTMLLHPDTVGDFELARLLAPTSRAFEGESAHGQLLLVRRSGSSEVRLCLTAAERVRIECELSRTTWIVPTPEREDAYLDRPDRWRPFVALVAWKRGRLRSHRRWGRSSTPDGDQDWFW